MSRKFVVDSASFASVPEAFGSTPEGVKHAVKMGFTTESISADESKFASPSMQLETRFFTDFLLLDVGAVDPDAIDPDRVINDCQFLMNVVRDHPDEVRRIIASFQPTAPISAVEEAIELTQKIGFTEEDSIRAGGGLIFLVAVAAAALLATSCATPSQQAKGKKTTPSAPNPQ